MFAFFAPKISSFCILLLIILYGFINLSCKPIDASKSNSNKFNKYKKIEANFNLGDTDKFEFTNLSIITDGNGRILVQYEKQDKTDIKSLGKFVRLSEDSGKTFGDEYEVAKIIRSDEKFSSYGFQFVPDGFAVNTSRDGNIFYAQSKRNLENFSEFNQINDEQNAVVSGLKFIHISQAEIYCVWIDKRRGFNLVFFSSSNDSGKTWSANQSIDYDFREGNQGYSQIVLGTNGRLIAVWQDWRDRKTLVDIRYSYSDDKGLSWSPSKKINDDKQEVWQIIPRVVADGKNIYVVFTDFREKGEENDNDWNIYFARSTDNGETWDKNKRLNDIKEGNDQVPFLTIDKEGNLYCLWESARETLFGQMVFSYSNDKGETWSPSIPLTTKEEIAIEVNSTIDYVSQEKLFVRLSKEEYGKQKVTFHFLEKTSDLIGSDGNVGKDVKDEKITPIKHKVGKTLFSDDFSSKQTENWEVESGVWEVVGGTYMGVYPNLSKRYVSYAKFEEPESYILQGRFRYDSVAHTAANLYIRSGEVGRYYLITNQFRVGTWLSKKDLDFPDNSFMTGGQPLVQKRFPFKQDVWYEFKLVVTAEQIDYYVDGRLMWSFKGKLNYKRGKIGIGGYQFSPTYFDDISVLEIE